MSLTIPDYKCPECGMVLERPKCTDMIQTPPAAGDLILCGFCANLIEVGIVTCTKAPNEKLDSMPEDMKRELRFAVRAVKRKIKQQ